MDPVAASKVDNYAVSMLHLEDHGHTLLGGLFKPTRLSVPANSVRLRSAQYDPATQSVTLIPKPRHLNIASVTTLAQVHSARTSVRPGHQSNVAPGLTDLQGNPINVDTTPGKVELRLKSPNMI